MAEATVPYLLQHVQEGGLSADEKRFVNILREWNYRNEKDQAGPTVFVTWMEALEEFIWKDELTKQPGTSEAPSSATTIDLLKRDTALSFIDDVTTPEKENASDIVTRALKKAAVTLVYAEKDRKLLWSTYKDAGIRHLLRMEPFSRYHLSTGGGRNVINAHNNLKVPAGR